MKAKHREWRVVNVGAIGMKYEPFKVFGEDEVAARQFMERGVFIYSHDSGNHRLESRPVGGTKDDWKEAITESVTV